MALPLDMQANGLLRRLEDEGAVPYANRIPVGFKLTPVAVQPDWRFDLAHAETIEEHCEGHFLLPSGKRTNVYIQVSLGLRYVGTSKAVGFQLYKGLREAGLLEQIDVLIGPPVGALAVVTVDNTFESAHANRGISSSGFDPSKPLSKSILTELLRQHRLENA